jgi:hypothetical protein
MAVVVAAQLLRVGFLHLQQSQLALAVLVELAHEVELHLFLML